MDGSASSGGFSGAGLPPRPTVSTTRRRPFVAPHSRAATSSSLDANLPRRQELPSPNSDGSGSRMPSPGGGRSGGRMPFPSGGLPRRLPNAPRTLGPRSLSFTEPQAATWDADRITSPAEVYQVTDDDFSPNHWTPDYSFNSRQSIDCSRVQSFSSVTYTISIYFQFQYTGLSVGDTPGTRWSLVSKGERRNFCRHT